MPLDPIQDALNFTKLGAVAVVLGRHDHHRRSSFLRTEAGAVSFNAKL